MTISSPNFTRLQDGIKSVDDLRVRGPLNVALAYLGGSLVTQLNAHFGAVSNSISAALSGTAGAQTYVEGTFVPSLTFGGGATGLTYATQTGTYTRVGRLVHIDMTVTLSAKGSSTGNAVIGGLPLAAAVVSPFSIQFSAMTAGVGDTQVFAQATVGTSISLQDIAAGSVASLTDADFTNSSLFRINGVYRTSA